ncbi:hypothetical protein MVEN_02283500 [Mycena venus]|uniref:Uncharacterized protein n=1 Tax=Mycena venus TaxID=2733690 RepID=A0A8H6X5I7_9AGAR|nr:hypothetical protein MVEN_02283500 [Mycena venus]
MLSVVSVVASLIIANIGLASPAGAAPTCNPTFVPGVGISIANAGLELGYTNPVTPGAPVISQALTASSPEFIPETPTTFTGGTLLKVANNPDPALDLYATWTGETSQISVLPLITVPDDPVQGWGFACSTCNDPTAVGAGGLLASGCHITAFNGQCVQIGSAAGDIATPGDCTDLSVFDVYV